MTTGGRDLLMRLIFLDAKSHSGKAHGLAGYYLNSFCAAYTTKVQRRSDVTCLFRRISLKRMPASFNPMCRQCQTYQLNLRDLSSKTLLLRRVPRRPLPSPRGAGQESIQRDVPSDAAHHHSGWDAVPHRDHIGPRREVGGRWEEQLVG